MSELSQFNPARARATAQRLRDGKPAVPMFQEKPKAEGDHIITNIGRPSHA